MYLYPDAVAGRQRVQQKLVGYADDFSAKIGLPIALDEGIIHEALGAAYSSAQFHQIPLDQLSHYKEVAHIGYWLAELKPIWVEPPRSPQYYGDWIAKAIGNTVFGPGAQLEKANKAYGKAEQAYQKYSKYPISEHIALRFVADCLEAEFLRKLEELKGDYAQFELIEKRFKRFKEVLYAEPFMNIVNGLRFHVFTPRSFSTLVEAVFAFEGF